jgi:hypothetical protein
MDFRILGGVSQLVRNQIPSLTHLLRIQCPVQSNGTDCGAFVLANLLGIIMEHPPPLSLQSQMRNLRVNLTYMIVQRSAQALGIVNYNMRNTAMPFSSLLPLEHPTVTQNPQNVSAGTSRDSGVPIATLDNLSTRTFHHQPSKKRTRQDDKSDSMDSLSTPTSVSRSVKRQRTGKHPSIPILAMRQTEEAVSSHGISPDLSVGNTSGMKKRKRDRAADHGTGFDLLDQAKIPRDTPPQTLAPRQASTTRNTRSRTRLAGTAVAFNHVVETANVDLVLGRQPSSDNGSEVVTRRYEPVLAKHGKSSNSNTQKHENK